MFPKTRNEKITISILNGHCGRKLKTHKSLITGFRPTCIKNYNHLFPT